MNKKPPSQNKNTAGYDFFGRLILDDTHFNGDDYVPERDDKRLTGQIMRVFNCMKDESWRSLKEIEDITGDPQASISAQLRHLRKPRFGMHTVNKVYIDNGLYHYQLIPYE
jgi:hypothetical protein|tara:strand:+ start:1950 stop:2282 length:333 start_codon:yes stop_codon:yes gene_type:complete